MFEFCFFSCGFVQSYDLSVGTHLVSSPSKSLSEGDNLVWQHQYFDWCLFDVFDLCLCFDHNEVQSLSYLVCPSSFINLSIHNLSRFPLADLGNSILEGVAVCSLGGVQNTQWEPSYPSGCIIWLPALMPLFGVICSKGILLNTAFCSVDQPPSK